MIMQRQSDGTYTQIGFIKSNTVITSLYGDGTIENSDTYDLSTGIITRRWGVKVFDGTEAFTNHATIPGWFQLYDNTVYGNKYAYCTHFQYYDRANDIQPGYFTTAMQVDNRGQFVFRVSNETTLDNFKSFLASEYAKGTPVTVYYPLAEPTTETITIPSGLTGTVIGNTTQDGTPTPETPIEVIGKNIYEDIEKIVDKNGDTYFTKGFTRQVTGYPVTLPDSIGKSLLDYKIYGNIFQDTGTVTGNKKLKDSSNKVIIDSEGNEVRTNEVVTYNVPSPDVPAEVVGCGDLLQISFDTPLYGDGTTENSDTCDLLTGIITRRWGVKVFDGTEAWRKNYSSDSNYLYYINRSLINAKKGDVNCTHLPKVIDTPEDIVGIYNSHDNWNAMYFNFGADIMNAQPSGNTIAGLKEYLASEYAKGTPVTVYYPLAEPTTETITIPSGLTGTVIGNTTQDGTPTPETPIEVVGVDKCDYYEIPVVSRGKNLFDENYMGISGSIKYKSIFVGDGSFTLSSTTPLQAGSNACLFLLSGEQASGASSVTNGVSFQRSRTVASENGYVTVAYRNASGEINPQNYTTQLELGSTATEYEPYHEPTTTPIYLPEPLYKDDYITKDNSGGKVHKAWGVKVFDGTENWSKGVSVPEGAYQFFTAKLPFPATVRASDTKNTHFDNGWGVNGIGIDQYYNMYPSISLLPDNATVDDFKSFLASEYAKGTPVTLYYPLAEPTEESIELPDIPTFNGTTIIETDTEIPSSNIEVSYKSKKLS